MTEKEYTKVVNRKCHDCGKQVSILCNETSQIVAVRCPDCFQAFLISTIEPEQLRAYLKNKGWEEVPIERKEVIKMCSPCPTFFVFIPVRKELVDYVDAMNHVVNAVASYYEKTVDELVSEVLTGVGEQEESWIKIWEEECGGRCAILHLERCPRYEEGECKFPDTRKAKEIVESQRN